MRIIVNQKMKGNIIMRFNIQENIAPIFVDTSKQKLRTDLLYDIYIVRANVCTLTNSIQVIFSLEHGFYKAKQYILVNYPIGSSKFYSLLNAIYAADWGEIIEVDTDDFDCFCGFGKIEYDGDDVDIDFESIELYCTATNKLHNKLYAYNYITTDDCEE